MQLPLKLIDPPAPTIADGVVGRNVAALEALQQIAMGPAAPGQALYLWGAPGSGKSFWLAAWARELGPKAKLIDCSQQASPAATGGSVGSLGSVSSVSSAGSLSSPGALPELLALFDQQGPEIIFLDNVDQANADTATAIFRLYNALKEYGLRLVCTAAAAPLRLTLRDDLRTRLGQHLIFELHELNDDEKKNALRARADRLGWQLSEELLAYLMTRLPRDLGLLTRVLDCLDQLALSQHRAATIPLLKELLDSIDATNPV
jgi:DnaA family protein